MQLDSAISVRVEVEEADRSVVVEAAPIQEEEEVVVRIQEEVVERCRRRIAEEEL